MRRWLGADDAHAGVARLVTRYLSADLDIVFAPECTGGPTFHDRLKSATEIGTSLSFLPMFISPFAESENQLLSTFFEDKVTGIGCAPS